jgi:hypothetical protein
MRKLVLSMGVALDGLVARPGRSAPVGGVSRRRIRRSSSRSSRRGPTTRVAFSTHAVANVTRVRNSRYSFTSAARSTSISRSG